MPPPTMTTFFLPCAIAKPGAASARPAVPAATTKPLREMLYVMVRSPSLLAGIEMHQRLEVLVGQVLHVGAHLLGHPAMAGVEVHDRMVQVRHPLPGQRARAVALAAAVLVAFLAGVLVHALALRRQRRVERLHRSDMLLADEVVGQRADLLVAVALGHAVHHR